MRPLNSLLDEYSESHVHPQNIIIHWICVPIIFLSFTGFLFVISIPVFGNLAILALLILTGYYFMLSKTLWFGMLVWGLICIIIDFYINFHFYGNRFEVFAGLFIIAWIGQFLGHKIEGKKPSFLKDLQFLLIGPAWLMVKIYKKLGIHV
jgi:uncharacterized membrane protein YGL010W